MIKVQALALVPAIRVDRFASEIGTSRPLCAHLQARTGAFAMGVGVRGSRSRCRPRTCRGDILKVDRPKNSETLLEAISRVVTRRAYDAIMQEVLVKVGFSLLCRSLNPLIE